MSYLRQFNDVTLCDGVSHAYARATKPKCWVQLALMGASLAASLYSGYKSSQAQKNAQDKADSISAEQKAANEAWYKRRYNENYLDTAAGQNIVRQARELADRQTKRAEGAAVIGGGTDASVALAKENASKTVSDTMSNIAAADTARKENVDNIHHQDQQNYYNQQYNSAINRGNAQANAIAQAGGAASNAMMTGASLINGNNTKKSTAGA